MKTTYLRISSALAVFFFSVGFPRVASAFDLVCPGKQTSGSYDRPTGDCTSPCPGPFDDYDRPTSSCTSSCPGPDDDNNLIGS